MHVVVDGQLRCGVGGKHAVFGSSPRDSADLWEAFVEKAFAKILVRNECVLQSE